MNREEFTRLLFCLRIRAPVPEDLAGVLTRGLDQYLQGDASLDEAIGIPPPATSIDRRDQIYRAVSSAFNGPLTTRARRVVELVERYENDGLSSWELPVPVELIQELIDGPWLLLQWRQLYRVLQRQ